MMALAIALLIGFSSAYFNLGDSARYTYQKLSFLDASIALRGSPSSILERVKSLPQVEAVEARRQLPIRIQLPRGEYVPGLALGMPHDRELSVNELVILQGSRLRNGRGELLLEKRFADVQGYKVGDWLTLEFLPGDHRRYEIVGLIASPEYLWLTPDRLDPRPAARRFGVCFLSHADLASLVHTHLLNELHFRFKPGTHVFHTAQQIQQLLESEREGPVRLRQDQPSYALLERDRAAFAGVAAIFPTLLLGLSGLMLFLTLWQLVHLQRKQIGILLCQGVSARQLSLGYLYLALFVGLSSALVGTLTGPLLSHWATSYYVQTLGLPFVRESIQFSSVLLGWSVSIAISLLAASAALVSLMRRPPLELLRSDFAPQAASRLLAFIPLRLNYRLLFPLRNLLRQPGRSLVMVAGISMANGLLLMTLAMLDSQNATLNFYLTEVHRYDLHVDVHPAPRSTLPSLHLWPGVEKVEGVLRMGGTFYANGRQIERGIWGIEPHSELFRLFDSEQRRLPEIPRGSTLLAPIQRRALDTQQGDRLWLEVPDGSLKPTRHRTQVGQSIFEPVQGPVKMDRSDLQNIHSRTFELPRDSINILLVRVRPEYLQETRRRLLADSRVREVSTMTDLRKDVKELVKLMMAYIGLMLGCAGLISLALVHACTTMNLSERRKEVAAMLVQGVRQRDLFRLLLGEALYLWVLGVCFGIVGGYWAGDWLLNHYQPDLIDLKLQLHPTTVVLTALGGLLVTLIASVRGIRQLLTIPLAEATRSPD